MKNSSLNNNLDNSINLDISLSLQQITEAVNGKINNTLNNSINSDNNFENIKINSISTDSRDNMKNKLFIALEGEKFDGHNFINQAIKNGAIAVIAHKPVDFDNLNNLNFNNLILVQNTKKALMDLAAFYRSLFDVKIVGITGSVGKTTTKDMVASVLSQKYNVLKTQENLNNEIGVSKTLLNLKKNYDVAVIEMGMSGFGEISELSKMTKPDIGIVTNIGVSHIETLGSRENIFKAKLEITDGIKNNILKNNILILNGDDDLLAKYENKNLNIKYILINTDNKEKYNIKNKNCVWAENLNIKSDCIEFDINNNLDNNLNHNSKIKAQIPCLGKHNIYSALSAYLVGKELNLPNTDIISGLKAYVPSGMRQKIVRFQDTTIIEDCYNASPDSMKAAVSTLSDSKVNGKKILVISDMLELGEESDKYHYEIGNLIAQSNIDELYCFGNFANQYVAGAVDNGFEKQKICFFENKNNLANELKKNLKPGNMFWFKASRGMKLEEVLKTIYSTTCEEK